MPFEPRFAVDLDFELDGFDDFLFAGADDLDVVFFFDTEPPAEELLTVLDDAAFNLEPEAARDGFDAAPFEELDLVERDFADEARDDAGFFEPDFDELDLLLEDFFVTAILFPPFISNRLK